MIVDLTQETAGELPIILLKLKDAPAFMTFVDVTAKHISGFLPIKSAFNHDRTTYINKKTIDFITVSDKQQANIYDFFREDR